jgi:uncharacterized membrane protein
MINQPRLQVITLGVLAGLRTLSAPAITSRILKVSGTTALEKSPLNFMQSATTANVLGLLAIGEFAGDKLPSAPNRIAPIGLIGRVTSGMLCGASIYKASGKKWYNGLIIGGAVAAIATCGSYYARRLVVKNTNLPDAWVGAIEDTIVTTTGLLLIETA